MAGKGRITGGLVVCLIGILGVCLACGLPMWREGSFVGSNIVTGQMIWDGLWLHCVVQSTGQMQCKRQIGIDFTNDLQAGRAIMLLSIIVGLIGFIIVVMGGGVANCSGAPPDNYYSTRQSTSSSENRSALLGGLLCVIAGILCLVSVIWSAALTVTVRNDPLVVTAMKRDVGTSIYVGLGSGVLLLVGGALVCMVCTAKPSQPPPQVYRPSLPTPYSYRSAPSAPSPYSQLSRMTPPYTSDVAVSSLVFAPPPRTPQYKAQPYAPPPESRAARDSVQYYKAAPGRVGAAEPRSASFAGTQPKQELFVQDTPSLTALLPREYYYNTPN